MKSNKGVTLMTLTLTVIVLALITALAVDISFSSYYNAQLTGYVAKMNLIQSRVNVINKKITEGETGYYAIGMDIPSLDEEKQGQAVEALAGKSTEGFKYFNKDRLELLGIEGIDDDIIINLDTREIFSLVPLVYEDVVYYNQYNLPNGIQKDTSNALITEAPQFELEKNNYGLTAEINVTNIVYAPEINGSDIYYGEVTDDSTTPVTVSYWKQVEGTSFTVTKTATYAVKVVDRNAGETIKTVDIVTCNAPEITDGMLPVIYENGKWKKVADNEMGKWYDYAEGKWANIMLSDGVQVASDGTINTMGSMFVWIPRFAYQITSYYHNAGTGISGNINVKFLRELTAISTEETTTKMTNASKQNNWNVHPAFTNGSTNSYANEGWDRELTGFWVAKFEASSTNSNATNGGGNVTTLDVKVLPNVTSWRGITVTNCYANCLRMNASNNIYGLPSNAVTHLMKNSEWGAVAYLTQSKYGRNGTEVTINNSSTYVTGNAGSTVSETQNSSGVTNAYSTPAGVLASTTGTIYGIYDMSGGAHDIVASALIDAVDTSVIKSSNKLFNIVTKSTANTGVDNYALAASKYGEAMYETSARAFDGTNEVTNYKSWNYDYNSYVSADYPLVVRGGKMNSNIYAGIFAFQRNLTAANGGAGSEGLGFRPTIVVE